jgi:catechol 2,3-dioxygenase-like lactoylglutathione lyase family enzyme
MITSIHTLIYSDDAPATRAFLCDVLGWPYVEDAAAGGAVWLIFKTGRSEMGVHPTDIENGRRTHAALSLYSLRLTPSPARRPRGRTTTRLLRN